MRHLVRAIALLSVAGLAVPAAAQSQGEQPTTSQQAAPQSAQPETTENQLIVRGLRLRGEEGLPVDARPSTSVGTVSRQIVADVDRFSRCADMPSMTLLRKIVDGRPDTGEAQKALHRHIVTNSGCYQGMPVLPPFRPSPYYGECNPIALDAEIGSNTCRVAYDRGAIFEQVLHEYAPDLRLSRSNTFDLATQDQFRAREERRNSARRSFSDRYFWIASCMVQVRPDYALAMLDAAPGSATESRYAALMISDGRQCVGENVKEVTVDPGQFRAFVAEAVYSWAVAVRRTDSLLPAEANG